MFGAVLVVALAILGAAQVQALDNGLARTPPMGWLAWARFMCQTDCHSYPDSCISSALFEQQAKLLKEEGYAKLGYQYVNIDDCWSEKERSNASGELAADRRRFPAGIRPLADHMHRMGLKLGIYGDCGSATCGGYPAQLKPNHNEDDNNFAKDASSLVQWQVDSFKFDGCNIDPFHAESICPKMIELLKASSRPILVTCEWPFYMLRHDRHSKPDFNLATRSCNTVRYYEDVEDSWASILNIVDFTVSMQDTILQHHGPGSWFDPDQLVIGNFGLSLEQARAQMAIWSIWSAPLFMSNDLRSIQPDQAAVLKNRKLISVNQDPMGVFGLRVRVQEKLEVFVKPVVPIVNGCPSFVIGYLNRDTLGSARVFSFPLRELVYGARDAIRVAARRYSGVYNGASPFGPFEAANCETILSGAMNAELPRSTADTAGKKHVYQVEDLINNATWTLDVASSLLLWVNPSGVAVVKLTQQKQ